MKTIAAVKGKIALRNILVATDFSSASTRALPYALAIANRYGAKLHIAHVLPPGGYMLARPPALGAVVDDLRRKAESAIHDQLRSTGFEGVPFQPLVGFGDVRLALADLVQENQIDLLVLGTTPSKGFRKLVLGSVAEEIIRSSRCPVLAIGPNTAGEASVEVRSILYATDFSPQSLDAAPYAFSLAAEYRARMILLHVAQDIPAHSPVLKAQALSMRLQNLIPPGLDLVGAPEIVVEHGPAAQGILKVADRHTVDMIVLGVRGAGAPFGMKSFLGTVTTKVVSGSRCPVLTVSELPEERED
jgi:nucleotide-binding universal stress UspA family protein